MKLKTETGYPSIDKTHLKDVPPGKLNPIVYPFNLLNLFQYLNKGSFEKPIVEIGEEVHTKEDLRTDALILAKGLISFGLKKGAAIGIATPNLYEGVAMTFAANAVGMKVFFLNEEILDVELARVKIDCLLLCDKSETELKELSCDKFMISIVVQKNRQEFFSGTNNILSFEEFKNTGKELPDSVLLARLESTVNNHDLLYIQTSGSTAGLPKILPFKNRNFSAFLSYVQASTGAKANEEEIERVLIIIPYRISYGWTLTFANICIGNCVRFAEKATPEAIGEYYKYKPTYIYGTPLILRAFMDATPPEADLSCLTRFYSAGFGTNEEQISEATEFFRSHNSFANVYNNYGIGEALCIGTTSDEVEHITGCSGRFYYGADWLIVDENMHEKKYGEIGEVIVASGTLCDGYYGDKEATKKAFVKFRGKTFFKTGDYASLDESGYVRIIGRKKRFYQPLGARDKVNCETIEDALEKCDLVKECAVVVYSPTKKYESSRAFIVLNDPAEKSEKTKQEIFEFLKTRLFTFQLPSEIVFLDELPRSEATKINYIKLENMSSLN